MKKNEWLVAWDLPVYGPLKYLGKFGCEASLQAFLTFNPLKGQLIKTTIEIPER